MTNPHGSKWIRPTTRLAIYLRDNLQCVYCLASLEDEGVTLTLDHVKPREKGGSNAARNLVTACLGCNSSRQMLGLSDWLWKLIEQSRNEDYPEDQDVLYTEISARVRNAVRRRLPRELARTLIGLRREPGRITEVVLEVGALTVEKAGSADATLQLTAAREAEREGREYDPTGLGYLPKDTPPRPLHGRGQG